MIEREAKFVLAAGRPARAARKTVKTALRSAGYTVTRLDKATHNDEYLDTKDHQLRHRGWSLRRRTCRRDATMTMKTIQQGATHAGVFSRQELSQDDAAQSGPVLNELHRLQLDPTHLQSCFKQTVTRRTYAVSRAGTSHGFVEWAVDQVKLVSPQSWKYCEFELEQRDADAGLLSELSDLLNNFEWLTCARQSKFERGLVASKESALLPTHEQAPITWQSDWAQLAHACIHAQGTGIKAMIPSAYEAVHPHGLHQLRVQCRRLQSSLKMFDAVLPKTLSKALTRHTRAILKASNPVRDLDVHLLELNDLMRRNNLEPGAAQRLIGRWLAQREDALTGMRLALDENGPELFHLLDQVSVHSPSDPEQPAPWGIEDGLGLVTRPMVMDALSRGSRLNERSRPARYHKLRVRLKHVRYELDNVRTFVGTAEHPLMQQVEAIASATRRLQNVLGLQQDATSAIAFLQTSREALASGNTEVIDALIQRQRKQRKRARRRFAKAWRAYEQAAGAYSQTKSVSPTGQQRSAQP